MKKNYILMNGNRFFVTDEREVYVMRNGRGDEVTIIEDYANDVSYYSDGFDFIRHQDATRAANIAFAQGYRE